MTVTLDGKDYPDFEKNPKVRSVWGEELIKKMYRRHLKIYRTDDIAKGKIKIEKPIKMLVDDFFKNKDFHSVDLICIHEKTGQLKKRKEDEKFVRSIIDSGQKFDLGTYLKKNNYGIIFDFYTDKQGKVLKRIPYLIPRELLFMEVKTWLSTSKPPVISITELYKHIYYSELTWILFALIKIDLKKIEAEVEIMTPLKFSGVKIRKSKVFSDRFVTSTQLPPAARTPFPQVVGKGKPYTPFLEMNFGDEVRIYGPTILHKVKIQIKG